MRTGLVLLLPILISLSLACGRRPVAMGDVGSPASRDGASAIAADQRASRGDAGAAAPCRFERLGEPTTLTEAGTTPSVTSTGQRFGVVWTETGTRSVRYRGLDLGGKALDPALTVGSDSHSWASLAENGQELAVCWAADPDMQMRVGFQRFDPSGVLKGGLQDIGGSSYRGVCAALIDTSVGWAAVVQGSYALEGGRYANRYGFALLDSTGAPRAPVEQLIALDKEVTTPALAFTGESYFVASHQAASRGILVQRVDGAGHLSGAAELVTQPSRPSYSPRLVWTGTTLVLAYLEQHPEFKDPTVALQVLGPAGTPVGPCSSVTTEDAASVLAASHADGVLNLSWVSARKAMPDRLLLARLDTQGRRLQSDLEIAAAPRGNPPNFVYTSVAGHAGRVALVWSESSHRVRAAVCGCPMRE